VVLPPHSAYNKKPKAYITMDVQEQEGDVQLQKASSELLADFESSLKPFIWRTLANGKIRIRPRVRASETARLLRLVRGTTSIFARVYN
jgi:hypothetical protein